MEGKLLTISIAAYNVEKFLYNTLNNLEKSEIVDYLEVFIIDDGGKDRSLEIAKEYSLRHPGSFFPVHKQNGGYGSTVSYSISHANGKYFKLLDGDDWFDYEGLKKIIELLKTCDSDVIITDYYTGEDENNLKIISCRQKHGQIVSVKEYATRYPHGMWSIFYKTEVLKKSDISFPEHTLYTDQIYSTIPFAFAKDVMFLNIPVYCYRFGRDEQSTSKNSRIKHADEMLRVCDILYKYYNQHKEEHNLYLFSRVYRYYTVAIRTILMLPINRKHFKQLKEYERNAKHNYPEIYRAAGKSMGMGKLITILRSTAYLPYWIVRIIPEHKLNS